jgi:hypothetical protein
MNDPDHDTNNVLTPALTSLTALTTVLNNVDMTSIGGRSGMPMLQFQSREGGIWTYGQKRTVTEENARWAVNPTTFQWGYISFSDANQPVGQRIVSVSQPKPNAGELPDTGFPWSEHLSVNLKCVSGVDAGTEVTFKTNTSGGISAITGMIEAVRDRLNGGVHNGKVAPIVHLEKDSYQHPKYGRIYTPMLTIVDWMPLDGPAPAPAAPPPTPVSPPAAEQPRRRRVA